MAHHRKGSKRRKTAGKVFLKRVAGKIARRGGFKKTIHGYGDFVGGIVAD